MITGKTKTGFPFSVKDGVLDNWELIEALSGTSTNGFAWVTAAGMLLGDEQCGRLKEHCREKDGHVSFTKMVSELGDIIAAASEKAGTKNS